jgi:L-threonylcarbamoyladenylate synthase
VAKLETRIIDGDDPDAVEIAAATLRDGGLVVFPTDTVYGVAASIDRPDAVGNLYVAKGRPLGRPIPVLISDFDQVRRLTRLVDPRVLEMLETYWPGALTVALPAADWIPEEVTRETGRVGLRMPDHPLALRIIREAGGALATTSANRSGEIEARTAAEALAALGGRVALIVDGGTAPGGVPSTVISADGTRLTVNRRGAIDPSAITHRFPSLRVTA